VKKNKNAKQLAVVLGLPSKPRSLFGLSKYPLQNILEFLGNDDFFPTGSKVWVNFNWQPEWAQIRQKRKQIAAGMAYQRYDPQLILGTVVCRSLLPKENNQQREDTYDVAIDLQDVGADSISKGFRKKQSLRSDTKKYIQPCMGKCIELNPFDTSDPSHKFRWWTVAIGRGDILVGPVQNNQFLSRGAYNRIGFERLQQVVGITIDGLECVGFEHREVHWEPMHIKQLGKSRGHNYTDQISIPYTLTKYRKWFQYFPIHLGWQHPGHLKGHEFQNFCNAFGLEHDHTLFDWNFTHVNGYSIENGVDPKIYLSKDVVLTFNVRPRSRRIVNVVFPISSAHDPKSPLVKCFRDAHNRATNGGNYFKKASPFTCTTHKQAKISLNLEKMKRNNDPRFALGMLGIEIEIDHPADVYAPIKNVELKTIT
jgi:hypothetical protein